MKRLMQLFVTIVAVYVGIIAVLYFAQRSLMYVPSGSADLTDELKTLGFETVQLTTRDDIRLRAWHFKGQEGKPCMLYFQGNALALLDREIRFRMVVESGFSLLAVSYRGYPGSEGSPTEEGLLIDGETALDWLERECADRPVIAYGESLGSGIAAHLGATRNVAAIILEAPYTAATDIAFYRYPFVPVTYLMKDQFRSIDRIPLIKEPVVIVHGTDDAVIPFRFGKKLFEAANEPKAFIEIPGGQHSDQWTNGSWPKIQKALAGWGVLKEI